MATSLQIPPHEVQRRLALDNPWWKAGQGIDREEESWLRRAYFRQFSSLVREAAVRRAVVLIGPRRVGKTVMLKHLIARLLQDGVTGTQVLFLSIDTPLYSGRSLESLVQMFTDLHRHPGRATLGRPLHLGLRRQRSLLGRFGFPARAVAIAGSPIFHRPDSGGDVDGRRSP